MNKKSMYGTIMFVLLIFVQLLLLKYYITRDIPMLAYAYILIVFITIFHIRLMNDIKNLSTIKKFTCYILLAFIFICFSLTKSRNIPEGNIIEKNDTNEYYVIVSIRNSQTNMRLYCDKFTYDLLIESNDYVNISYTISPITQKYYLKRFQLIR